ncbi:hypothetical protein L227DRAFT_427762 [Lentinus tigrinus ALCF2SS1-6]|uniref:Uncharacterized protein n=2 Tax=Lentinus tigrinus TaxID=5365 RepID=A0A5C2RR00_9APHY|nr:hypothetical protein L227DRAFT_427762 [Lentinus tigrinus ALCF2SS1-6]
MVILQYCATEKGLVTRIRVFFRRLCEYWRPPAPDRASSLYRHYRSAEEEDEYWRSSAKLQKALRASDANAGRDDDDVPLVRYYTPKLLPTYREEVEDDPEAREVYLAPKAFCKWHRMVFPGPMHPTLKEAQEQIKYYSSRDRKEILRISRIVSDDQVLCRKAPWTPRFAKMWKDWLTRKGPDVAIVFE